MALKSLGAEHYKAIMYLAQEKKGGLTYEQIAKECNVHPNSLYNWRKDPLFERELKRQIVRNTQEQLPELMNAMIKHAITDGNAAAAKLILTANDMLTERHEVTTDVKADKDIDAIKAKLAAYKSESTTE